MIFFSAPNILLWLVPEQVGSRQAVNIYWHPAGSMERPGLALWGHRLWSSKEQVWPFLISMGCLARDTGESFFCLFVFKRLDIIFTNATAQHPFCHYSRLIECVCLCVCVCVCSWTDEGPEETQAGLSQQLYWAATKRQWHRLDFCLSFSWATFPHSEGKCEAHASQD